MHPLQRTIPWLLGVLLTLVLTVSDGQASGGGSGAGITWTQRTSGTGYSTSKAWPTGTVRRAVDAPIRPVTSYSLEGVAYGNGTAPSWRWGLWRHHNFPLNRGRPCSVSDGAGVLLALFLSVRAA